MPKGGLSIADRIRKLKEEKAAETESKTEDKKVGEKVPFAERLKTVRNAIRSKDTDANTASTEPAEVKTTPASKPSKPRRKSSTGQKKNQQQKTPVPRCSTRSQSKTPENTNAAMMEEEVTRTPASGQSMPPPVGDDVMEKPKPTLAARIALAGRKRKMMNKDKDKDKDSTADDGADRRMTLLADRARNIAGRLDELQQQRDAAMAQTRQAIEKAVEMEMDEDEYKYGKGKSKSKRVTRSSKTPKSSASMSVSFEFDESDEGVASTPTATATATPPPFSSDRSTRRRSGNRRSNLPVPPIDTLISSPITPVKHTHTHEEEEEKENTGDVNVSGLIDNGDGDEEIIDDNDNVDPNVSVLSEHSAVLRKIVPQRPKKAKHNHTAKDAQKEYQAWEERMKMHFAEVDDVSLEIECE